uniref:Uncharacterized protein n=1 Tax=Zea mays TaxID=4577 RepID=C4J4Y4_MAIZE|nr:unknown [Zea mays]ACR36894.1 unknown [Zea mays]
MPCTDRRRSVRSSAAGALGRLHGEAVGVDAVVVDEVVRARPHELVALVHAQLRHLLLLPPVAALLAPRGLAAPARLRGVAVRGVARPGAPVHAHLPERGLERRVRPVRLHAPALRRPVVRVPDGAVHGHRLRPGERRRGSSQRGGGGVGAVGLRRRAAVPVVAVAVALVQRGVLVHPDGRVVHHEHHLAGVPQHGVRVEVGRGVEPQVDALLPVAHAVDVQVGLHQVRLAGHVAQELEVELVVLVPGRRQLQPRRCKCC